MIRLHLLASRMGPAHRRTVAVPWDGQTLRELVHAHRHPEWADDVVVTVTLSGRRVEDFELDMVLSDGAEVGVAPEISAPVALFLLTHVLVPAAIGMTAGFIYQALVGKPATPKPERGDIESPTYAWDGITTTSGAGFQIPAILGKHRVGGQLVGSRARALSGSPNTDVFDALIAWGYGRIEAVGTTTGGTRGEVDELGALFGLGSIDKQLPTTLKINGNNARVPGIECSLRMGEVLQSPIGAFPDSSTAQAVNGALDVAEAVVDTVIGVSEVDYAIVRLRFPNGLYRQSAATGQYFDHTVSFEISWAVQGSSYSLPIFVTITRNSRARFFTEHLIVFGGRSGPFDVRVKRRQGSAVPGNDYVADSCEFQTLSYYVQGKFAYPGVAVMHLAMLANERLQGALDLQVSAVVKGLRVATYDATFGLSPRYWELPASGSWSGIWSWPPGQNPAWCALEVLTATWGGAPEYSGANIDFDSFRDFADHCDETIAYLTVGAISGGPYVSGETITGSVSGATGRVSVTTANGSTQLWFRPLAGTFSATPETITGGTSGATSTSSAVYVDDEAPYTFDGTIDRGLSAWEQAQAIVSLGRGVLYKLGSKVAVAYEYRGLHGRGTNTVPERTRSALINTANVESFTIDYVSTKKRPNTLHVEILNADLDYEHDTIVVEDPNTYGLNAPYKLRSELQRVESLELFGCTSSKRARREGLFAHAINRLTRTVVNVKAGVDALPMLPKDVVGVQFDAFRPYDQASYGYRLASAAAASTTITLDHAVTINSAIGQTRILIRETDGTIAERQITMANGVYAAGAALTISAATTAPRGAPVTVGYQAKLVRDYSVTSIRDLPDHKRELVLTEYHPEAFDIPASASLDDDTSQASTAGGVEADPETVDGPTLDIEAGRHVLTWGAPDGKRPGRSRVHVATGDQRWSMVGEADATALVVGDLTPHKRYSISVAPEDRAGLYVSPYSDVALTIAAPEFPAASPGVVGALTATVVDDGILLAWGAVSDHTLAYYEIRRGAYWVGAEVLARTRATTWLLELAATGTHAFMVRARHVDGCYSPTVATASAVYSAPTEMVKQVTVTDLVSGAAGTLSSVTWDAGVLALRLTDDTVLSGTYTTGELDLTFEANARWSELSTRWWVDDTTTLAELDITAGSGEARWFVGSSREPSPHKPGFDLDTYASALPGPTSDYGEYYLGGGRVGHLARVRVEARYYYGGAWTSYAPIVNQRRVASKMQVRYTLERGTPRVEVYLQSVKLAVNT